jgi:glycosyltransferase involved in cell wall biosynthesis
MADLSAPSILAPVVAAAGEKLKIVTVMTTTADGGAEFAAMEMLWALEQRGHDTVMVTDRPSIARDTGVRVHEIDIGPKLSRRDWPKIALSWPLYLRRLRQALEAEMPYDVLLVHYKKEQLMARQLPRRLRSTLIWAEWGPVPFQMRSGPAAWAYRDAAKHAGAIMAISRGTLESVAEVGVDEGKIEVVPNVMRGEDLRFSAEGRERVRRELGIPQDAFVVGCISRFHPKKRNDVLVDAMKLLDDRPHLILAGAGETEAELRELAKPLGERAHFVPTPGDDVADYTSAFDVSVFCPSPTEGAPRAVILPWLAGRPAISTGAMGVADMITPDIGEIASPENDPATVADILRGYLDDPERVEREGHAARERALQTYDAPVVAERIEQIFRQAGAR